MKDRAIQPSFEKPQVFFFSFLLLAAVVLAVAMNHLGGALDHLQEHAEHSLFALEQWIASAGPR